MNDGGYMAISPLSTDIMVYTGNVYDAAYFVGVSHSSDGGTTWEHDTIGLGTRGWAVAFDGVDTNRIYVGGDSSYSYPCLLISTDLGTTWTQSRAGLAGVVNALLTIPGNGELVYAGTTSGLFVSTDAGATWAATSLTRSVKALICVPGDPQHIVAGTYGYGVHATTDGGLTWSDVSEGLTCKKVLSLALRADTDSTVYAGTEGGSVFKLTTGTGLAGSSPIAPRQSSITITPNPCRDFATISSSLSLLSPRTSLSLYDASGRLVRSTALSTPVSVLRTEDLRPGTYFVRVTSGREAQISRLTVLK